MQALSETLANADAPSKTLAETVSMAFDKVLAKPLAKPAPKSVTKPKEKTLFETSTELIAQLIAVVKKDIAALRTQAKFANNAYCVALKSYVGARDSLQVNTDLVLISEHNLSPLRDALVDAICTYNAEDPPTKDTADVVISARSSYNATDAMRMSSMNAAKTAKRKTAHFRAELDAIKSRIAFIETTLKAAVVELEMLTNAHTANSGKRSRDDDSETESDDDAEKARKRQRKC
jgi:hypothetical protein